MCGVTGFFQSIGADPRALEAIGLSMAQRISARGPDDCGVWKASEQPLVLAHRRLSVVDLSSAAHQPMISPSGRYVLVFNGEIYNHLDLRRQLQSGATPVAWRGHSDTESLLASFDAWGIDESIKRAVGMFAFAVWDKATQTLTLARDRLGEKPLYYGWYGDTLLFGSELKSFRPHPAFNPRIDRGSLALLMRHNCIPAPHTIYQDTYKLLPGCVIEFPIGLGAAAARQAVANPYWRLSDVALAGLAAARVPRTEQDLLEELHQLLKQSVAMQMVADVPLGAFLSGGVDSSAVVALMQEQSARPVKTFTIGFDSTEYDEAQHAALVAKHLGAEHTELAVTAQDARDVISHLPAIFCEPFSDSSQIPTFLISKLTRQHVTVSLSGDAGDELFGGYNRHRVVPSLWKRLAAVPAPLRRLAARSLASVNPAQWQAVYNSVEPFLPTALRVSAAGDKAHKLAAVLDAGGPLDIYRQLTSHWKNPADIVVGGAEPGTLLSDDQAIRTSISAVDYMMLMDALTYLPDDILVKVDRAAMAASLETRVPFLDHRVVEFAWRLPLSMKIRDGQSKWALRQILYKYVPKTLIERPKMGFGVPLDEWLRGPLRDWAEDLLDENLMRQEGYLSPGPIRRVWVEHLSGKRNWQYQLWDVLMFQAWYRSQA